MTATPNRHPRAARLAGSAALITIALLIVACWIALAATPAHAAASATRADVAWIIGERWLFEDVTPADRRDYLTSTTCFDDIAGDLNGDGANTWRDRRTRKYICHLKSVGALRGPGGGALSPHAHVSRRQASVVFARIVGASPSGFRVRGVQGRPVTRRQIRNLVERAKMYQALEGQP